MATPLSAKTARLLRPVSIADDPTASNAYRSNANLFSDSPSHAPIRLDLAEIDRSPVPVQTVATSPMTQKRLSTDVGVQSEQEPAPGARVLPMASIVAEAERLKTMVRSKQTTIEDLEYQRKKSDEEHQKELQVVLKDFQDMQDLVKKQKVMIDTQQQNLTDLAVSHELERDAKIRQTKQDFVSEIAERDRKLQQCDVLLSQRENIIKQQRGQIAQLETDIKNGRLATQQETAVDHSQRMHELKEAIQLAAQRDLESAQQEIAEKDRHIAQLEEMRKRQSFGSPGDTSRSPQGKLTEEEKDALYEYKKTVQAYADREIEAVQNKANHECEEMAFRCDIAVRELTNQIEEQQLRIKELERSQVAADLATMPENLRLREGLEIAERKLAALEAERQRGEARFAEECKNIADSAESRIHQLSEMLSKSRADVAERNRTIEQLTAELADKDHALAQGRQASVAPTPRTLSPGQTPRGETADQLRKVSQDKAKLETQAAALVQTVEKLTASLQTARAALNEARREASRAVIERDAILVDAEKAKSEATHKVVEQGRAMEAARREAEQDKHSRDSAARSAAQHLALLEHKLGGAHEQLAAKEAEVVAKGRGLIDAKTALARKEAELVAKGRELTDAKRALEQAKAEVEAANTRLKDQHEHASAIQRRLEEAEGADAQRRAGEEQPQLSELQAELNDMHRLGLSELEMEAMRARIMDQVMRSLAAKGLEETRSDLAKLMLRIAAAESLLDTRQESIGRLEEKVARLAAEKETLVTEFAKQLEPMEEEMRLQLNMIGDQKKLLAARDAEQGTTITFWKERVVDLEEELTQVQRTLDHARQDPKLAQAGSGSGPPGLGYGTPGPAYGTPEPSPEGGSAGSVEVRVAKADDPQADDPQADDPQAAADGAKVEAGGGGGGGGVGDLLSAHSSAPPPGALPDLASRPPPPR